MDPNRSIRAARIGAHGHQRPAGPPIPLRLSLLGSLRHDGASAFTEAGRPASRRRSGFGEFKDDTAWPQHVYKDIYGLNCLYYDRAQLLAEGLTSGSVWVASWLRADWPLQPYIQWADGIDYHTIILGGVYADGRVRVLDPGSEEDAIHSFQDMMQGYGQGTVMGLWYDVGLTQRANALRAGPPAMEANDG